MDSKFHVEKNGSVTRVDFYFSDLMSMMMQCSDLSTPREAKGFVRKTAIRDVHIGQTTSAPTYTESKLARHWDNSTNQLSDLFTVPGQHSQNFLLQANFSWVLPNYPVILN